MKIKIAKKLLIKTLIVAILMFILLWFLGNYIYPFVMETKSLFIVVLYGLICTIFVFGLVVCYQFAKEYIKTIRKN